MSNKINFLTCIALVTSVSSVNAQDTDIEETVVVGQRITTTAVDPVHTSRLASAVLPAFTYNPGGYGGVIGFNQTGAQSVHTTVFVNGIPANEPGTGLYDFGHDIASGQTVRYISGPNGVLYGSGSIAGTVLIEDTIDSGVIIRHGTDHSYASVASNNVQLLKFNSEHPSVRNDNTEKDRYSNVSGKFNYDFDRFTVTGKYTDYEYDYDNCYTASFSQSNDCRQIGDRYVLTASNDHFVLGRSENKAEFFTEQDSTFSNTSSRDYVKLMDTRSTTYGPKSLDDYGWLFANFTFDYGVDYSNEEYNEHSQQNIAGFFSTKIDLVHTKYSIGIRRGNDGQNSHRFGFEQGKLYASIGTSFRRPNLYELHGDSWVQSNPELEPEEGRGVEFGYGPIGFFKYRFQETIDYNYSDNIYYNAGKYNSKGVTYSQAFGPVFVTARYTDTTQPRTPKYAGTIEATKDLWNTTFTATYAFNLDRKPGPYDGTVLEDLHKINVFATKDFNDIILTLQIENLLNDEIEVVPFYSNIGRQFSLTLEYEW